MSSDPKRASSVIAQMSFLRSGDPELDLQRGVQLIGEVQDAADAGVRYRAAVLAHDDLAERLRVLFHIKRADHWTGYVPPRIDHDNTYSDSPYRAALVELVVEALKRNQDHAPYDATRLAAVPESHIRAPWKDNRPQYIVESDRSAAILGEAK